MTDDFDDGISLAPVQWCWPGSYPSRCTEERALHIAESIRRGATLVTAAASLGIAPSRVREWMRWGEEAYRRDADERDIHSSYLNLFLKVVQAIGLATVAIQHRAYIEARDHGPQWWLMHYPEIRSEWAGGESASSVLVAEEPQVVDADAVASEAPRELSGDKRKTRDMLRILVESGAAVPVSETDAGQSDSPDEGQAAE